MHGIEICLFKKIKFGGMKMIIIDLQKEENDYLTILLNIHLRECEDFTKQYAGYMNSIFKNDISP